MKKYLIKKPFSLLERVLVIDGDEVYAELIRKMYHVYSVKTRKRLGTINQQQFEDSI